MFDKNMRDLPLGDVFFCKIHYCNNNALYDAGARADDIVKCEMLSANNENPTVRFYLEKGVFQFTDDSIFEGCLVVYEGNLDGTGFICDDQKIRP